MALLIELVSEVHFTHEEGQKLLERCHWKTIFCSVILSIFRKISVSLKPDADTFDSSSKVTRTPEITRLTKEKTEPKKCTNKK